MLPSLFGNDMIDRTLIIQLVEDNISGTDIYIVDVEVKFDNIISIVLDSDTSVSIDNCADINKSICNSLESLGEDIFEVTVYSAGLSEPLKLQRQYIKHVGEEVAILLKTGEQQKGILRYVDDACVEIEYSISKKEAGAKRKQTVISNERIEMDSIKSTKLVIKV
jgi:ribosome maturation factor RimP